MTSSEPEDEYRAAEEAHDGLSGLPVAPVPQGLMYEPLRVEPPSFTFLESLPLRPMPRTPNFADAVLFGVFMLAGLLVTTVFLGLSVHYHWFGLGDLEQAVKKNWLALGSQLLIYAIGLAVAVPFFRTMWGKPYFVGLHWHGATAKRLALRLLGCAVLCNVLAMLGDYILPFPEHAPIDKMFSTSTDAWMLTFFGVLIAPLFEEMIFRGFLLPAMATAWDWAIERSTGARPRPLDAEGQPVWSAGAMIFAAMLVSVPFALMHSAQLGQAWGPLLLLYCVSLVLCTVRFVTRSLAASTLVHSIYNAILFGIMLVQTDGFRHLDKI
jgi:membrane protease YdiL (CAAX protease family)